MTDPPRMLSPQPLQAPSNLAHRVLAPASDNAVCGSTRGGPAALRAARAAGSSDLMAYNAANPITAMLPNVLCGPTTAPATA